MFSLASLQDAISIHQWLVKLTEEIGEPDFYKSSFFPVLECQDVHYVVECDPSLPPTIYSIWVEGGDTPVKKYESTEQMLQVYIDAYLSGAFYLEDNIFHCNEVLFHRIKNKHFSEEQRIEKEDNWNLIKEEAEEILHSQVRGEDFIHRLIYLYDERAIPLLQRFLDSPSLENVAAAASGLGQLRSRESIPDLLELCKHPEERVRCLSVHAIRDVICPDDKLLLRPLLEVLDDYALIVRFGAVEALGKLRNREAIAPLIKYLKDENHGLRLQVVEALRKIGDPACLEVLRLWKDKGISDLDFELDIVEKAILSLSINNS